MLIPWDPFKMKTCEMCEGAGWNICPAIAQIRGTRVAYTRCEACLGFRTFPIGWFAPEVITIHAFSPGKAAKNAGTKIKINFEDAQVLRNAGKSFSEIAKHFGVDKARVRIILEEGLNKQEGAI